jgi:hypothetical protein
MRDIRQPGRRIGSSVAQVQASRAADEVIEYGTRTSDIVKVFGRRSFNGHDVVPFVVGFGAHNGIA